MVTRTEATIEDLSNAPRDDGTYELVNGALVHMSPTGFLPGRVSLHICIALMHNEEQSGSGRAVPDNVAFLVDLPRRKSFSPDASYTFHPPDNAMRFIEGAPVFAAEVHSEGDYGPAADRAYAAKQRDYFAAGTRVVWDVNPVHFSIGDMADAEPALPDWRVAVNAIFRA